MARATTTFTETGALASLGPHGYPNGERRCRDECTMSSRLFILRRQPSQDFLVLKGYNCSPYWTVRINGAHTAFRNGGI